MKEFKGMDTIGYTDLIWIIFDNICIKKYVSNTDSLDITFDMLLMECKKNGYKDGTILVIAESPLSGKVYKYGNYGPYWIENGTTLGYA